MARVTFLHQTLSLGLLIGFVLCQLPNDLNVNDLEKELQDNLPGLPTFNASEVPSEADLEKLLKQKCEENGGGEEAFNALKNQKTSLQECIEKEVNATQIKMEITEAKKTGSMDEVFAKYCKRYPEIKLCLESVTNDARPCLTPKENETMNTSIKIINELQEFLCDKDGDRMAMFIAEGGVECLSSKRDELQLCVNKTVGDRVPTDFSPTSIPLLVFTDRECNDFDTIQNCVVSELEHCEDSTPANIVQAFFKFLKKQLPCTATIAVPAVRAETSSSSVTIANIVMVVSMSILKYHF